MIRKIRISCTVLVALLCAACEQPPPPPPPPPVRVSAFLSCAAQGIDYVTDPVNAGKTFVSKKVSFLAPGFDPQLTGSNYHSPQCNNPVSGRYLSTLSDAFTIAAPSFKEHLCGHTCVFVNENPCHDPQHCTPDDVTDNSWGFREQPSQSTAAGRYIATSKLLWKGTTPPDALDTYESAVLNRLLKWKGSNKPKHGHAIPDNGPDMTVLAALAHELGHVRWFDVNVPSPGGSYDFTYLMTCADGTGFFANSWQFTNTSFLEVPNRWRQFGDRPDVSHVEHKTDPKLSDIFQAIDNDDERTLGGFNNTLHSPSQPWPSLFGSFTPDEDFVETYRLWVLEGALLQSFPLTIPFGQGNGPSTQNIALDVISHNKPELERKINCVANAPYR